jgi:hypothetical protein
VVPKKIPYLHLTDGAPHIPQEKNDRSFTAGSFMKIKRLFRDRIVSEIRGGHPRCEFLFHGVVPLVSNHVFLTYIA